MSKRRKGELNVFSMSFLDAITAGFGCVVLLFMLVSANAVLDQRVVVEDREAEARRWELRVLTGQRNLVALRERARGAGQAVDRAARDAPRSLVTEIQETEVAARDADRGLRGAAGGDRAPAPRARRAQPPVAGARDGRSERTPRTRRSLRAFEGEGNRQYLTGLRMGGKHVAILVDTSTSMLDRTIVNILRRRNMSAGAATPCAEVAASRQHRRLAHDADRRPARTSRSSASTTRPRG